MIRFDKIACPSCKQERYWENVFIDNSVVKFQCPCGGEISIDGPVSIGMSDDAVIKNLYDYQGGDVMLEIVNRHTFDRS